MTYLLISIIIFLSLCIVWLSINYTRSRQKYKSKVGELNLLIVAMSEINAQQSGQLVLSDELRIKLNQARMGIDRELLALQADNIATLQKNNLLD